MCHNNVVPFRPATFRPQMAIIGYQNKGRGFSKSLAKKLLLFFLDINVQPRRNEGFIERQRFNEKDIKILFEKVYSRKD